MTSPAAFFAYARERHAIYLRRQAGPVVDPGVSSPVGKITAQSLPGPWTTDPILQQYRFTNVFRELDRTTIWFRKNVRERLPPEQMLLATVVFRWFNRITTGEAIFLQGVFPRGPGLPMATAWEEFWETLDVGVLRQAILAYCGKGPYVTGAYIIKTPEGYTKLDGVLWALNEFVTSARPVGGEFLGGPPLSFMWRGAAVAMQHHPWSLEMAWKWFKQFPYLGDFMSYEIVTDLRHTSLLDRAPDIMTWANPGPGAARGASRVFMDGNRGYWDQHRNKQTLIKKMRELLEMSQSLEFWPGDWPAWEMREVEHTLCEFDKYERVRCGEGAPRGRFR